MVDVKKLADDIVAAMRQTVALDDEHLAQLNGHMESQERSDLWFIQP